MNNKERLINANKLQRRICGAKCGCEYEDCGCEGDCQFDFFISNAPTVDAVEVVHGRWIFGIANHREYMKCSECLHSQTPTGVFSYCPNCGAKMGGGTND